MGVPILTTEIWGVLNRTVVVGIDCVRRNEEVIKICCCWQWIMLEEMRGHKNRLKSHLIAGFQCHAIQNRSK